MQQSEEKAVCNDAVAPAAQCQQTFADDDDNTNSFDAFAFFLCLVKMSVYFHCQSVDQGGNLLGALTSAPTAASKKRELKMCCCFFSWFCHHRSCLWDRKHTGLDYEMHGFLSYRVIFDYISPVGFIVSCRTLITLGNDFRLHCLEEIFDAQYIMNWVLQEPREVSGF